MMRSFAFLATPLPFFLEADAGAMAEQQQWFAGEPNYENWGLAGGLRFRGPRRSPGEGAGADQTRCGLRRTSGQQRERRNLSGECCSSRSGVWQRCGSAAVSGRGSDAGPTSPGAEPTALAVAMAAMRREPRPGHKTWATLPTRRQMQSLSLPAIQAQLMLDRKIRPPPCMSCQLLPISSWGDSIGQQYFLPLSRVYTRQAYLRGRTGHCRRRRVPEDYRPQRHRLELLDGSIGASRRGSRHALQSRTSQGADADAARVRALAAYDFLTLWKVADPDIPI